MKTNIFPKNPDIFPKCSLLINFKGFNLFSLRSRVGMTPWYYTMTEPRIFYSTINKIRLNHSLFPAHFSRIGLYGGEEYPCDGVSWGCLIHLIFDYTNLRLRDRL